MLEIAPAFLHAHAIPQYGCSNEYECLTFGPGLGRPSDDNIRDTTLFHLSTMADRDGCWPFIAKASEFASFPRSSYNVHIMSMDILDLKTGKGLVDVNRWTFPSMYWVFEQSGLFTSERLKSFCACISMAEITDAETKALSRFIRSDILPTIPDGGRLFPDGSVTAEPDDGVMHVAPDRNKNFGADRGFFVELANACEQSGGFILR